MPKLPQLSEPDKRTAKVFGFSRCQYDLFAYGRMWLYDGESNYAAYNTALTQLIDKGLLELIPLPEGYQPGTRKMKRTSLGDAVLMNLQIVHKAKSREYSQELEAQEAMAKVGLLDDVAKELPKLEGLDLGLVSYELLRDFAYLLHRVVKVAAMEAKLVREIPES